jgi:hypothetical protein
LAYIEAFLYFVLVIIVVFIGLSFVVIAIYWIYSQFRFLYRRENPFDSDKQKGLLENFIKHKFFKLSIIVYFIASFSFYVNQSFNYYGKDRAYPEAKAYAITADTVWFWQSMLLNVKINRGFGSYYRLLRPEDTLDTQVQKVQTFLLNRMYQHIPKDDGERDYWYYKYKQYYKAQIRYKPGSVHQPLPRLAEIMDDMHITSQKLLDKPIKDRVLDKERYLAIAQMSVYLARNIAYFTPFKRVDYVSRLFKLMEDKELFQKSIKHRKVLHEVYKRMKKEKNIGLLFDKNPYRKGFLYASLLNSYNKSITYNSHNNINPCTSKELKIFTNLIQDFYAWIFVEENSSFKNLSKREKKQIMWLYNAEIMSQGYVLSMYLCEIPFRYVDDKNLPIYGTKDELYLLSATRERFISFTKLEKMFEEKKLKEKE